MISDRAPPRVRHFLGTGNDARTADHRLDLVDVRQSPLLRSRMTVDSGSHEITQYSGRLLALGRI